MGNKKTTPSNYVAILLVIAFCTGMIPSGTLPMVRAAEPFQDQIVTNPSEQTEDDTLLSYRKSIVQTDTDTFTITLDVSTQQEIKTIAGKGASVVLVLDNSGSMALGEGSKTPATYAREALKAFANQFLNGNNSKNKLGLVSYHGGIGPQFDAYDDIEYITKNSLTSDPDVYCDVVDRLLQPSGETNVQMGIKVARDILGADSSDNLKYIVLFSDGAANKSANPTGAEALGKSFISPYSHNGKDYDTSFKFTTFDYSTNGGSTYDDGTYSVSFGDNVTIQMLAAISESFLAEQEGITIYSVFYANPKLSDLEDESFI